eukprot:CAMPEP_0202713816 /NCGR_PEP_ID=MMETSP1385-20130828/59788_1 /ASSEMBLY_ACC=CAM_ASM_000861 /TAXON_ID=933848 /ORGANISM="Elphidium margaritaceum" /LENGTH=77 /DNA_ID=CAMNT_0049374315 /DNA_START=19 /DNA_END=252 /DNA_ORIENTATION=+
MTDVASLDAEEDNVASDESKPKPRPKKNKKVTGKKTATEIAAEKRKQNGNQYQPKFGKTGTNNQVDTNIYCGACYIL